MPQMLNKLLSADLSADFFVPRGTFFKKSFYFLQKDAIMYLCDFIKNGGFYGKSYCRLKPKGWRW